MIGRSAISLLELLIFSLNCFSIASFHVALLSYVGKKQFKRTNQAGVQQIKYQILN